MEVEIQCAKCKKHIGWSNRKRKRLCASCRSVKYYSTQTKKIVSRK